MLKFGFALCVFNASAASNRNTQMLFTVSPQVVQDLSYDIPRAHDHSITPQHELLQKSVYSTRQETERYFPVNIQSTRNMYGILRPVNNASVTRVPNSASKRSRSGVRAKTLNIMWRKLRCIRGNVFRRYTAERGMISAGPWTI